MPNDLIRKHGEKEVVEAIQEQIGCLIEIRKVESTLVMKSNEIISLPFFKKSSGMYKGMELNKKYTLEELGL